MSVPTFGRIKKPSRASLAHSLVERSPGLLQLPRLLATRLQAYGVCLDSAGRFWSDGQSMTDNHLWLLLRADAQAALPTVPSHVVRSMVAFTLKHIRDKCQVKGDERVYIVAELD